MDASVMIRCFVVLFALLLGCTARAPESNTDASIHPPQPRAAGPVLTPLSYLQPPGVPGRKVIESLDGGSWVAVDASSGGATVTGVDGGGVVVHDAGRVSLIDAGPNTVIGKGQDGGGYQAITDQCATILFQPGHATAQCACSTAACVAALLVNSNGQSVVQVDSKYDGGFGSAPCPNGVTWDLHYRGSIQGSWVRQEFQDSLDVQNGCIIKNLSSASDLSITWDATSVTPFQYSSNVPDAAVRPLTAPTFSSVTWIAGSAATIAAFSIPHVDGTGANNVFTFVNGGSYVNNSGVGALPLVQLQPGPGGGGSGGNMQVVFQSTPLASYQTYTFSGNTTNFINIYYDSYISRGDFAGWPGGTAVFVSAISLSKAWSGTSISGLPTAVGQVPVSTATGATAAAAWATVPIDGGTKNNLPIQRIVPGTPDGGVLTTNGTNNFWKAPTTTGLPTGSEFNVYQVSDAGTVIAGPADLASSAAVRGLLPIANGGTGTAMTCSSGQYAIAQSSTALQCETISGDETSTSAGVVTNTCMQSGAVCVAATTALETIANTATGPGITLASPSANAAAPNFVFTPGTPFNGSGATALQNTPASWVFGLVAPGTTGVAGAPDYLETTFGGNISFATGQALQGSAATAIWINPTNSSSFTPSNTNWLLENAGGTVRFGTSSGPSQFIFQPSGSANVLTMSGVSGEVDTAFRLGVGQNGGSYGGAGIGAIFVLTNPTNPTSTPAGGSVIYADNSALGMRVANSKGDIDYFTSGTTVVGTDYSAKKFGRGPRCEFVVIAPATGSCVLTLPAAQTTYGSAVTYDARTNAKCVAATGGTPCTVGSGSTSPDGWTSSIYASPGKVSPNGTIVGYSVPGTQPSSISYDTTSTTASEAIAATGANQVTVTWTPQSTQTGTWAVVVEIKDIGVQ
jgi:hypothetical protein